jgi:hypothetical protein
VKVSLHSSSWMFPQDVSGYGYPLCRNFCESGRQCGHMDKCLRIPRICDIPEHILITRIVYKLAMRGDVLLIVSCKLGHSQSQSKKVKKSKSKSQSKKVKVKVKVTLRLTVSQSVSMSWCRAQIWDIWPEFFFLSKFLFCLFGAPSLTRGRVCHVSVFVIEVYHSLVYLQQYLHVH